jgi:hypothetical protein
MLLPYSDGANVGETRELLLVATYWLLRELVSFDCFCGSFRADFQYVPSQKGMAFFRKIWVSSRIRVSFSDGEYLI